MKKLKDYQIGYSYRLHCPYCGEDKGRTWLLDESVECWNCYKISNIEEWD